MGCVDVVGPRGVQETVASQATRWGETRKNALFQNVWTNFHFSFMTGAKGHLLRTAFLDFLNKYSREYLRVYPVGFPQLLVIM